jgi:hypothetical protein
MPKIIAQATYVRSVELEATDEELRLLRGDWCEARNLVEAKLCKMHDRLTDVPLGFEWCDTTFVDEDNVELFDV